MPKVLLSLFFVLAIALFGASPFASAAQDHDSATMLCPTVPDAATGMAGNCKTPSHTMSGICAIVCIGAVEAPLAFASELAVAPAAALPLHADFAQLNGRDGVLAYRPPQSI
ncbi:hypothetical protein [Abyssibius alkaniclasticus]|uniref:hypothetical protein n=1 Tax=Abyssibius alkaniclasticus TaxID=2881234 RepID=UPI00405A2945